MWMYQMLRTNFNKEKNETKRGNGRQEAMDSKEIKQNMR